MLPNKCTKLPLPGEIYTVVWGENYRRLVRVVSYEDEDRNMIQEFPPEYQTWLFKSESLEGYASHGGLPQVNTSVQVHNPGDECLIWSVLREPTEEDLKRRVIFDE